MTDDSPLPKLRELLAGGKVNPKDLWLADQLIHHTAPDDLTPAQTGWMESLVARGGGPYEKTED